MLLSATVYATFVTFLIGGAAWALEKGVRGRDVPTRWIWVAGMAAALTVTALTLPRPDPGVVEIVPEMPTPVSGTEAMVETPADPAPAAFTVPGNLDDWVIAVWAVLSLATLTLLTSAVIRLHREKRTWKTAELDGRQVLVAEQRGPAVVGLVNPQLVVPRWLLGLARADREFVLRHEEEHRAAGDARLLMAALVLVALLPWNAPLWWMAVRLRLALEIDCDRRVLRGADGIRRYASLLIDLGVRVSMPRLAALAFVPSVPFLERRIRAMTDPKNPHRARLLVCAALTALLLAGACRVDQPGITAPNSGSDALEAADVASENPSPFVLQVRLDRGAIVGLITNRETGEPVPDVEVWLPQADMGGLTNSQGRFMLLRVPPGEHTIMASHKDYGEFQLGRVISAEAPTDTLGTPALGGRPVLPSLAPVRPGFGAIVGTIREEGSDRVLGSVEVSLPSLGIGALTNIQGRFLLLNVPVGTHTLLIEHDGYGVVRREVTVEEGRRSTRVEAVIARR